jgi:pimeloyl-ACP methyl ester carboxylesterase
VALSRLAEKKLWPPLLFGSAVMSWYEHIGRTVCLLLCRNHRLWERLLRLVTGKDEVDFRVRDLTRHTHHSAWHTMHNVICGGARLQDRNLEAVDAAGVPVMLIHGVQDAVVPVECSRHLKAKLPRAELRLMAGCDHATVVLGRERGFAEELAAFWSRCRRPRRAQCTAAA